MLFYCFINIQLKLCCGWVTLKTGNCCKYNLISFFKPWWKIIKLNDKNLMCAYCGPCGPSLREHRVLHCFHMISGYISSCDLSGCHFLDDSQRNKQWETASLKLFHLSRCPQTFKQQIWTTERKKRKVTWRSLRIQTLWNTLMVILGPIKSVSSTTTKYSMRKSLMFVCVWFNPEQWMLLPLN